MVRRDNQGRAITRKVAYGLTLARTQFLRDSGYTVVEKWEHEEPTPWANTCCLEKQTETYPHAIVYDFESYQDKTKAACPTHYLSYEENPDNFERLPIWYNSLLRVANQPIFYRDWSRAGINHVKDILNQDSNFLSFADFKTRYQVKTSFLKYYGVVSSIKNIRKQDQHYVADNSENESTGLNLLSVSNLSRVAYKRLLQKISSTPLKSQDKWLKDCNIDGELINWKSTYALPFQCTRETKLRVFQFKLLHRRIATNNYLSKIGLSSTDICSFCKEKVETLIHLFWECSRVQIFWQKVQSWLIEHKVISQNFPCPNSPV